MIRTTEADVGRRVVWTNRITGAKRTGRIERLEESFAWVLYDDDPEPRPRATIRSVLEWEEGH